MPRAKKFKKTKKMDGVTVLKRKQENKRSKQKSEAGPLQRGRRIEMPSVVAVSAARRWCTLWVRLQAERVCADGAAGCTHDERGLCGILFHCSTFTPFRRRRGGCDGGRSERKKEEKKDGMTTMVE